MEQEKISWSPEAEIKVTGREFEFLARLVSMFEIPLNQLSIKDYQELFFPAVQVSQDILKRMLDEGIAIKGEFPSESTENFTVLKNDAE
jgi:hypothetical protein